MSVAETAQKETKTKANTQRQPQNILTNNPATNFVKDSFNSVKNKIYDEVSPIEDEAMKALHKKWITPELVEKLKQGSDNDYYKEMDYGITLPKNQESLRQLLNEFYPGITKEQAAKAVVRGRNNWIVWTGGNDRFWTDISVSTLGSLDFLKIISNHPSLPYKRENRWTTLGVVNEPNKNCFKTPTKPDKWGLYLDERIVSAECPADPFDNPETYPGVKTGARGTKLMHNGVEKELEVGSFYGKPTGILGLRLFTNPDFNQEAANKWDANKYYTEAKYYEDARIIRPYRVGMSCAFCHVGPNPSRPPEDFNNPKWENLSANVGAQYFWFDRLFNWKYFKDQNNFLYQLIRTNRPGALDTSLVSSDQINNPRTMNAIYDMPARAKLALAMGNYEKLKDENGDLLNAQFNSVKGLPKDKDVLLNQFYNPEDNYVSSPRVLKDGSDSVGLLGALNRVYVNIGLFSELWLTRFTPFLGGSTITPFDISKAERNSVYWQANVKQTPDLALYLLAASRKDSLAEAPGGSAYLNKEVTRGKEIFAQNCASCHSSKLPRAAYEVFNDKNCSGKNYMECWNKYVKLTTDAKFKSELRDIVLADNFLKDNFLSNEVRVPINVVGSQLCSPIATNAIKNDIWDNFSSSSYKKLPSVGTFIVNYPTQLSAEGQRVVLEPKAIEVPGGGRGYLRPPSLISLWATAPFLQNNTLGLFDERGTVEGRMLSFEDSIKKLLNPELRDKGLRKGEVPVEYTNIYGKKSVGAMDVTTAPSFIRIPKTSIPILLKGEIKKTYHQIIQDLFSQNNKNKKADRKIASYENEPMMDLLKPSEPDMVDMIEIGPIPAGIPINLLSNIDLTYAKFELQALSFTTKGKEIRQGQENFLKAIISLVDAIHESKKILDPIQARDKFMEIAAEDLVKASKCSDMVVNRGHYFGTKLSKDGKGLNNDEQAALIEFLKHF